MATAKKLPSGSWRVRVYIGRDDAGKAIYKSFTGSDKRKIEKEAAAYAEEHRCVTEIKTFKACAEDYISSKSNILSPTTYDEYRRMQRSYFDALNDLPVDSITNSILQNFVNDLAERLAPKSVINIYRFAMSAIYSVEPSKRFNVSLPKRQKIYRNLPEPSEIIKAVKGTDIELTVMLALWLSLRMSEIRGLRKEDISSDGVLTINNVMVRTPSSGDVLKEQTKTYDSKRRIQLPQYIIDMINETETEFVVPLTVSMISKRFKAALSKAGLPDIRFHDLRHLNASVMLRLGVPDKYAMERGGWSSPGIMKDVYQHTFSSDRRLTDKKIDDYFNGICHEI